MPAAAANAWSSSRVSATRWTPSVYAVTAGPSNASCDELSTNAEHIERCRPMPMEADAASLVSVRVHALESCAGSATSCRYGSKPRSGSPLGDQRRYGVDPVPRVDVEPPFNVGLHVGVRVHQVDRLGLVGRLELVPVRRGICESGED